MNRELEERIVAMYFDNEDFERNAKSTIDTLGQLKQSLKFDDEGKDFSIFEKIGKTLKFDDANKGLSKMKNTLGGMKGALGNVFKIGSAPLREAEGVVSSLNGYISKYVGFDIAGKIVNGVEGALRKLTVEPISAGWGQYEAQMDSVKTIMSSTGESIDVVNAKLGEMTDYANKTIYSLTDMTSNLGKFTNNGVELDDAVKAMEGIANATADAGQGAQQASMAMYNISQAIGVGKMTTIDWKSLENANIATKKLKNTFLEMAAIQGKIEKKVEKNGSITYLLTKDEDGKALKESIQLTEANFREYLSKGWLDKDTMLRTFQIYSGQINEGVLESWGIHDEETKKKFMEIGQNALEAATQVRTFSKMMDALKESAQSGWARSFELIFGDMEEGTALWTGINDKLDAVLSASAERRNKILEQWRNMDEEGFTIGYDSKGNRLKEIKGGRDIMIDSIHELMDLVQTFSKIFTEPFEKVFGTFTAQTLMKITVGFRDLVRTVTNWIGTTDDANSRLSKLQRIMTGIASIIKLVLRVAKAAFNFIKRIASPIIDFLIDAFAKIGDFFADFGNLNPEEILSKVADGIRKVWDNIKKWFTPKDILDQNGKATGTTEIPVITWLRNVWDKLKGVVKNWAQDNGLGAAWETISGWWSVLRQTLSDGWSKVTGIWEQVKSWFEESGISDFLSGAWEAIAKPFTRTVQHGYRNGRLESWYEIPVVSSLISIWEGIRDFWNGTILGAAKPIWDGLFLFLSDTWSWLSSQFTSSRNVVHGYRNGRLESWYEDAPIISWLKGIWEGISSFWYGTILGGIAKPVWNAICKFGENTWAWIKEKFTPGTDSETGEPTPAPVISWLSDIYKGIEEFWNNDIKRVAKPVWEAIYQFCENTWAWIVDFCSSGTNSETGEPTRAPIMDWLSNIGQDILKVWNDIKEWGVWKTIHLFISDTWAWLSSRFSRPVESGYRNGRLESWYADPPIVTWIEEIWQKVQSVWDSIVGWEGWGVIGEFISRTGEWLLGLLHGDGGATKGASEEAVKLAKENAELTEETGAEVEETISIFEQIIKAVGGFISEIVGTISGTVISEEASKFLANVFEFLTGLLETVGGIMGSFGRLMTGGFGNLKDEDWTYFLITIGSLISGIIVSLLSTKWQSKITMTDSIAKQFMHLAIGITLIAGAVALLTTIDPDKLYPAVGVVTVIGVVLAGLLAAIGNLSGTVGANALTGGFRVLNNLINKGANIAMLAIVINGLPPIISAIKDAKTEGVENLGDDLLKISEAMMILIGGIGILFGVLNMIAPAGLNIAAAAQSMGSIVVVIGIITLVILALGSLENIADALLGEGTGKNIRETLQKGGEALKEIGAAIGGFLNGLVGGIFGVKSDKKKTEESLEILDMLGEASNTFDIEKISGISRMMSMVSQLSSSAVKFDTGKMADFGKAMGEIGNGIYEIAGYISEVDGPLSELHDPGSEMSAKMHAVFAFIKEFGESLRPIGTTGFYLDIATERLKELAKDNVLNGVVENINAIIRGLQKVDTPESGIQFDGIGIVKKLFTAIQEGLDSDEAPAFDATPIVDAITLALTQGDIAIAQIVHDMVQSGLDMAAGKDSDASGIPDWLISKFGNGNIDLSGMLGGQAQFDQFEETAKKYEKLLTGEDGKSGLVGDMNSFKDNIPDMNNLLSEKGWDSMFEFKDEEGNDIDLVSQLQGTLGELQTTMDSMEPVQVKITPIFDFDNLSGDRLREELGMQSFMVPIGVQAKGLHIDFTGLSEELDMGSIRTKLENLILTMQTSTYGLQGSINSLAYHMDGIASQVSRMSLYLDTGVLVGGIIDQVDEALMQNAIRFDRQ